MFSSSNCDPSINSLSTSSKTTLSCTSIYSSLSSSSSSSHLQLHFFVQFAKNHITDLESGVASRHVSKRKRKGSVGNYRKFALNVFLSHERGLTVLRNDCSSAIMHFFPTKLRVIHVFKKLTNASPTGVRYVGWHLVRSVISGLRIRSDRITISRC